MQEACVAEYASPSLWPGEDYLLPARKDECCHGPLCQGGAVVQVKGIGLCLRHYGKLTDAVDRGGESLYGLHRDIVQLLGELE